MDHPIDEYVKALELYKSKKRYLAAEGIAKSIGGSQATEPILSSMHKIFNEETTIHRAVLDTIVSEAKKRDRYVRRS